MRTAFDPKGALALTAGLWALCAGALQAKELDQAYAGASPPAAAAGQALRDRQAAQRKARSAVPQGLHKEAAPAAGNEPETAENSDAPSMPADPEDRCGAGGALCGAAAATTSFRCQMADGATSRSWTWKRYDYANWVDAFGTIQMSVASNLYSDLKVTVGCATHRNPETRTHYCEAVKTVESPGDIVVYKPLWRRPGEPNGEGSYCNTSGYWSVACGESEHKLWVPGQGTALVTWTYEHHKSAVVSYSIWGGSPVTVGFSIGPVNITPNLQGGETWTDEWKREDRCQLTEVP